MTEHSFQPLTIGGLPPAERTGHGLVPKAPASGGEPETRVVKTACRACIANCGVLATVKNGRVVSLRGNPEDPMSKGRMCAKGLSGIQALYHPNRNKYPMKRVGPSGNAFPGKRPWTPLRKS